MEKRVAPIVSVMIEEAENIERALSSVSFGEFCEGWQLKRAVQRGIEIISEASRRLPENVKAEHPEVNWRQVGGIGNILRHEYHRVSDKVIWDVVRAEFPSLKAALHAMAQTHS